MRLSESRIQALQKILKDEFGLDYTDEVAQQTGLAIIRLVVEKIQQDPELLKAVADEHNRVQDSNTDI